MKLFTALVALSTVCLTQSTAFAADRLRAADTASCTITVPFKLKAAEQNALIERGFTVRVKRSEFTHSRMLNVYEYYEVKDSSRSVGDLHLKSILVPKSRDEAALTTTREFALELTTANGVNTIAFAKTVPARLARNIQEATDARFDGFPICGQ